MIIALYMFIALLVLVVCIAIISIRSSQRRNKTTKLDKELFGKDDEDDPAVSAAKLLARSRLQYYAETPKIVIKTTEGDNEI